MPFRFVFTGQTAALRNFLNQLASFQLPVLVREVEVDVATAEDAVSPVTGEESIAAPDEGTVSPTAPSIVLSVEAPHQSTAATAAKPKAAQVRAPRPSTATPIVSKPLSRFTVIVEAIELVPPRTEEPAAEAEPAPAPQS
jgi:hypothetical protein